MSSAASVPAGDSLLLGSGRQLALLETDDFGLPPAAYTREEDRGRWTGDRLFLANPQVYGAIARLLARGMTYREIADILQVSVNTVCGVVYREQIPIETLRERIGRLGLDVAQLSLESIRELLADPEARRKISAKDLAIIHGIAATNAQLFTGGPTARIEAQQPVQLTHDAYLDAIKNVTVPNVIKELTAPTSSGGETAPANGALSAPGVIEIDPAQPPSPDTLK